MLAALAERAQGWLRVQLQPSGLIDSFADSQPACFTYDQAVAAIALLARQDIASAQGILERMQALQQADGSWYTVYDCARLSPVER